MWIVSREMDRHLLSLWLSLWLFRCGSPLPRKGEKKNWWIGHFFYTREDRHVLFLFWLVTTSIHRMSLLALTLLLLFRRGSLSRSVLKLDQKKIRHVRSIFPPSYKRKDKSNMPISSCVRQNKRRKKGNIFLFPSCFSSGSPFRRWSLTSVAQTLICDPSHSSK